MKAAEMTLALDDSGARIVSTPLVGQAPLAVRNKMPRHDTTHQFFWVNRGGGRALIDGIQQGFGPNSAIYIPAHTVYQIDLSLGAAGWQVSLPVDLPIPLPQTPVLAAVTKPLAQSHMTKAFVGIQDEFIGHERHRGTALIYAAGTLAILFSRLDQETSRKEVSKDSARRRLMRGFVSRLNERYQSGDTVRDYATHLGVTTTHLTRVCRETAGKPATQMIQDKTLEAARHLLARSTSKVGEISETLGFSSPAYFTRLFSEKTGQSPMAYRRTHRGQPRAFPH